MYYNVNRETINNINNVVENLKKLLNKIIEKLSFSNQRIDSHDELVEFFANDEGFCNDLKAMKTFLEEISLILEPLDIFLYEFNDFLSIKLMCNYIIDNLRLYVQYSLFINSLLSNFFNLIHSKINNDKSQYNEVYSKFEKFLDEKEKIFYLEIYEGTHKYDDLIDEVTSILG